MEKDDPRDEAQTVETRHMPQLDALRAFAVAAVLIHHFVELKVFDYAFEGVKLFFVLSGFLITGILLRSRDAADASGRSLRSVIKGFYVRRALRIFPLYYLLVIIGLILNLEPAREALAWFLTYTLNYYMVNLGWYVANYAHFWTLAVEEQFYIIWPWIVLFVPRKLLIPATIIFISIGPLFRFYGVTQEFSAVTNYISTPACLDSLGMGALLAIVSNRHSVGRFLKYFALPVGLVFSVLLLNLAQHETYWKLYTIFYDLALALFFCWLVYAASHEFEGIVGYILEWPPLTYIGRISYGIYVYHLFMPNLCRFIASSVGFEYPEGGALKIIIPTLATVGVASLSWHLFEKPINQMKRYFGDANPKPKSSPSTV